MATLCESTFEQASADKDLYVTRRQSRTQLLQSPSDRLPVLATCHHITLQDDMHSYPGVAMWPLTGQLSILMVALLQQVVGIESRWQNRIRVGACASSTLCISTVSVCSKEGH